MPDVVVAAVAGEEPLPRLTSTPSSSSVVPEESGSSGTPSPSGSTPRTDNRDSIDEEAAALPERTLQASLETITPERPGKKAPSGTSEIETTSSNEKKRRTTRKKVSPAMESKLAEAGSPKGPSVSQPTRSPNGTPAVPKEQQQQPTGEGAPAPLPAPRTPASSDRRRSRRHRRSHSEEQFAVEGEGFDHHAYQHAGLSQIPPGLQQRQDQYYVLSEARHRSGRTRRTKTRSDLTGLITGPSGFPPPATPRSRDSEAAARPSPPSSSSRRDRRPTHHRVRSLPQVPTPAPGGMKKGGMPPPRLSASGNPLIPILTEGGHTYDAGVPMTPDGSRRKRKQYSGADNRARASSASHVMYGSFPEQGYGGVGGPPPPPAFLSERMQQQLQHQQFMSERPSPTHGQTSQKHFSPRGEILSLAGAFSSPRRARSGSFDGAARARTPPRSPAQVHAPPNSAPGYTRMSPRMSPPPSALRGGGGGAYGGDMRVSFSPMQKRSLSDFGSGGAGVDFDGMPEDFIQSTKSKGNKKRSAQSMRKMHMRQKSVELFMEDVKGTVQPTKCRDVLFGLLFVLHLGVMGFLGITYGPDALKPIDVMDDDSPSVQVSYRNIVFVACLSGAFAVTISTLALVVMTLIVRRFVQVALCLTIVLSFAWGTIGIGLSPKNIVPITGIIALALSVGYTFIVWDRIPFAAANLHAALKGVGDNAGIVLVAFAFQGLALIWSIFYTIVVIGVYDALTTGELVLGKHATNFVYTMLAVSYYWTFQVLLNIVQVTVAGTIGSWWFKNDGESSFCVVALTRNLKHALTYSFGSICFGSLLIGPVRFIRQLSAFFRPQAEDDTVLMCLHECLVVIQRCITSCVDNLASYFNPWAFTYVGLYGYGLLEAGHNATILYEKRGWTMIVADDLIPNVLLMISLVIGGVTGCFAFLIQTIDKMNFSSIGREDTAAFLIGFAVGVVLSSVLLSIISSSVNAVITCFAGSPVEFEECHPELSEEMRSGWREVWPGCMDVLDMNVALVAPQGGGMPGVLVTETTPLV